MADRRTPAQHHADIAACTLDRLQRIAGELDHLFLQFQSLCYYAAQHPELGVNADHLLAAESAVAMLLHCAPEDVRTMASKLPLRGLEFGCEAP
ncbi:hypothetical protein [Nocardia sp. CA-145437]|uniref:hypothetical protein n=1 Tax=Nocardia sp. CA-145437 TaxID=3239980 RepID=UPI003D95E203